jgi:iron complex outermembrane recepter protein
MGMVWGGAISPPSRSRVKFSPRVALSGRSALAVSALSLFSSSPVLAQDGPAGSTPQNGERASVGEAVQEIIVTAQRRSERLTDVPYNISAISSNDIAATGTTNANDLAQVVVGLGAVNEGPVSSNGNNNFTLRGLRSDQAGKAEVPFSNVSTVSTYYGDSPLFFSVLLKDLERVEVLRGPQGTLYGSGAEGGTIRFIPKRPTFDGISGEVNASGSYTNNAVSGNGSIDGVFNIPVDDKLAFRFVAAYNRQAGFIDKVDLFQLGPNGVPVNSIPGDITSGPVLRPIQHGANSSYQLMLKAEARYRPTDWLDLEVDYLHQKTHADDMQTSNPNYPGGPYDFSSGVYPNAPFETRQGGKLRNTNSLYEPTTAKLDLVSGTGSVDLGFATLTSVSTYFRSLTDSTHEVTSNYVIQDFSYFPYYNNYPVFTAPSVLNRVQKGFTQEVRLVSNAKSPLTYVVGAYYEHQTDDWVANVSTPGITGFSDAIGLPGANPQLGDFVFGTTSYQTSSEIAAFGEPTWHITKAWQVTGGLRVFKDKVSSSRVNEAPFLGEAFSDGVTQPLSLGLSGGSSSDSVSSHIYKLNTSYDIAPDTKIYATVSRGFRRGGANAVPTSGGFASLPLYGEYQPDYAQNYEIGLKGLALEHALTYSLSLFRIDFQKFQVNGFTGSELPVILNGNQARSQGLEAETTFRVTPQLTVYAGYTYTDAKVAKGSAFDDLAPFSTVFGGTGEIIRSYTIAAGALLPGVSKHTALASADYRIPLHNNSAIVLRADGNYRSPQNSTLDVTSVYFAKIPSNFTADARVTYESGQQWSASMFVTNLTNSIGYTGTSGIQLQSFPNLWSRSLVSRPRTIGVDLHYGF